MARVVYNSGIQKVINDLGLAASAVAQRLGKVGLCGLAGLASGQSVVRFEYHPRCTASGCKEAGALSQSPNAYGKSPPGLGRCRPGVFKWQAIMPAEPAFSSLRPDEYGAGACPPLR